MDIVYCNIILFSSQIVSKQLHVLCLIHSQNRYSQELEIFWSTCNYIELNSSRNEFYYWPACNKLKLLKYKHSKITPNLTIII